MTFKEKYNSERRWSGKVMIMEIYHLTMTHREQEWTISKTASHFGVSIGLVSENLRLAKAIHQSDKILKCETRQEALRKLNG